MSFFVSVSLRAELRGSNLSEELSFTSLFLQLSFGLNRQIVPMTAHAPVVTESIVKLGNFSQLFHVLLLALPFELFELDGSLFCKMLLIFDWIIMPIAMVSLMIVEIIII